MKIRRIEQTEFQDPDDPTKVGDCWRACLAMVTDRPLEQVPHFLKEYGGWFWIESKRWLRLRGFAVVRVLPNLSREVNSEAYDQWWENLVVDDEPGSVAIWTGLSPRSPAGIGEKGVLYHSIVEVRDGAERVVLDPHPSEAGIHSPIDVTFVVPYCEVDR